MKLFSAILLNLCLLVLNTSHAAEYAPMSFKIQQDGRLNITGDWPDNCVPVRQNTEAVLIADAITVKHASSGKDCSDDLTPFKLVLTLSTQTGHDLDANWQPEAPMTVQFLHQAAMQSFARLIAFDVLVPGFSKSSMMTAQPESGIWWPQRGGKHDTSGPGIGFSIERQGDQLIAIINWYDNDGSPLWLLATGHVKQGVFRAELSTLEGGPGLFEDYAEATPVFEHQQLSMIFHGPSTATAWISQPQSDKPGSEILLKPLSLVRFAFGYQSIDRFTEGRWLLVSEDSEGSLKSSEINLRLRGSSQNVLTLADSRSDYLLKCTIDRKLSTTPARFCHLNESAHKQIGTFTEVGLDRMVGVDEQGNQIQLIRLDTGW